MKGPWQPSPRPDCEGSHITIVALTPGDVARCRLCGALTLPSGRTSKRKKAACVLTNTQPETDTRSPRVEEERR